MPQPIQLFSHKHPVSMYLLSLTMLFFRFAFYGVGLLLVLFLVKHYHYDVKQASHLFALFTGLSFLLPILGGYIGDQWNFKSPPILGALITATGCFLLSSLSTSLILPGLILVGLGSGLFIPSIYTLLGKLYIKNHHLREGGFSIFYSISTAGLFLSMLILGATQTVSWKLTFIIAGISSLLSIVPYFFALNKFKDITIKAHFFIKKKDDPHKFPLKKPEKDRIIVIFILVLCSIIFWIGYSQIGSSMTVFILKYTQREIGQFSIPTPWFISLNNLFVILFAFPLSYLYLFLRKIRSSATPPEKTAISLFFMGLAFILMDRASHLVPAHATSAVVNPYFLVFSLALLALAELFLAPIGLALVTGISPHRYRGLLTGFYFSCTGIGFFLGGAISGLMQQISLSSFFDIFIFLAFVPAFLLLIFGKKLDSMRHPGFL
jgi:proton-dependent oligopeptide transporter, POT family